jgi:hypothetical protein
MQAMTGFLLEVRVDPADEFHCEDGRRRCPMLPEGPPKCAAFPEAEIKRDWSVDAYACAIRCPECVAAERDATDAA